MDDDEHRLRSLESGRNMLEKYKGKHAGVSSVRNVNQHEDLSEEESMHNEKFVDQRESLPHEGLSSRDITHSSMSVSEGETDGYLEGMAGRLGELEEILKGKGAIIDSLYAEIDSVRAEASSPNSSQSQNSNVQLRDLMVLYRNKVEDLESAIKSRDDLIEELTLSLNQALKSRDAAINQIKSLNSMQMPNLSPTNSMNLQKKINQLESSHTEQRLVIDKLNGQLVQIQEHVKILEMEKESLNQQIRIETSENGVNNSEFLDLHKQYEMRVEKIKQDMQHVVEKLTAEKSVVSVHHQQEIQDLRLRFDAELMNTQRKYEEQLQFLKEENKMLSDRLNKELPNLETQHAKELSVFQTQLADYKTTVEALKSELVSNRQPHDSCQSEIKMYKQKLEEAEDKIKIHELAHKKEKEMLYEQIELHKIQLNDVITKYKSATSILGSRETLERSLDQAVTNTSLLKKENEELKWKLDDLSSRYLAAQSLIENNQARERTLTSKMHDLEKSLARFSSFSSSTLSELNHVSYLALDDSVIENQLFKKKLEEKAELEKLLTDKINNLEEDVCRKSKELDEANLTKKSYEKQLKDIKNTCDKLQSEISILKQSKPQTSTIDEQNILSSSNNLLQEIEKHKREIEDLKEIVKHKDIEIVDFSQKLQYLMEKSKKSNEECEHLKKGLATAWAQCASFQEKLNQSLGTNDSKVDIFQLLSEFDTSYGIESAVDSTMNDCTNNSKTEDSEKICMEAARPVLVQSENQSQIEIAQIQQKLSDYDVLEQKFKDCQLKYDLLLAEKHKLLEENASLKELNKNVNEMRQNIDELTKEKLCLCKDIQQMIEKHKDELDAVKLSATMEVEKVQTLLASTKEENIKKFDTLKQELEKRHADEMEEIRKYFEQKCLQMEKQYSEDIFSQQSKKMSDSDSEIEQLADDLYLGGAVDCLSVSRPGTPIESDLKEENVINKYTIEADYKKTMKTLQDELEIRDNEIQNLKLQKERELGELRMHYEKELQDSQEKNNGRVLLLKAVNQKCQTEGDSLENNELSQLRADYNRQLEEQVVQIRIEVVNGLKDQIQALLNGEEEMSSELLELRDKFTSNTRRDMEKMKELHSLEIVKIKEEAARNMVKLNENYQKELENIRLENNGIRPNTNNSAESRIVKERNNLHKLCMTLKALVGELIRYFIVCEEEVNSTLISEVIKRQISDSTISSPEAHNVSKEENKSQSSKSQIRRVHFAPLSNEIQSILNDDIDCLENVVDDDITDKLKKELNSCLHRLKCESAQILGYPIPLDKNEFNIFLKDVTDTECIDEDLRVKLFEAEELIMTYQEESKQLKAKIIDLQQKLINAECKKEIISEGYGEHDESLGDPIFQDFSQLQEKARHALTNGDCDSPYLLQLIEELCRESDKMMEDAKKDKEDLQQQVSLEPTSPSYIVRVCCRKIEAADKQLRATRKFLDEQASEREIERDEFARQIKSLQEQLKEREREKERDLRITCEQTSLSPESPSSTSVLPATDIKAAVEALESQMRQMSSLMSDIEAKKFETENKLKAAVDNILYLRDVISHLEQQLQAKLEQEESLQIQIQQLEAVIAAQTKNQEELANELDAFKMGTEGSPLNEHINHLEEELRKHKLSSEHFNANSAVLKQIKMELRDMQSQLDKRIKELESVHICGSNLSLSQPSEDVSIRDQIEALRCPTPDDPDAPLTLPLDQILKLKEKMQKHIRVEEVALKRIKDLEIQLATLKNQNEELQAEHEILQQTTSEQLFQLETMKGRLEQHKQNAPFAQRQATSRLELQLHETNTKVQSLERMLNDKELEINELKCQLERTSTLLQGKEDEIANVVRVENLTIKKLKDRVEILEEDKKILESKLGIQERAHMELPQLIDNILADKNEEIDHLKEQLSKRDKQLDAHLSIPLEDQQSKEYYKQMESKHSARTLSDILSIHSECEDISEAIRAIPNLSNAPVQNVSLLKPGNGFTIRDTFEMSAVPLLETTKQNIQIPPLDLGSDTSSSGNNIQHLHISLAPESSNSDETDLKMSSSENKDFKGESINEKEITTKNFVRSGKFTKTDSILTEDQIKELENQLGLVRAELRSKVEILDKRDAHLANLQKNLQELQSEFNETIEAITRDKQFYKNQYESIQTSERKIRNDLLEVENILKLKTEELDIYKGKIQANENIIVKLNSENEKLKKNLKDIVMEKDITIETIQTRNFEIENENKQLYEYKTKYEQCKLDVLDCQNEIRRLTEGLNSRDHVIRRLEEMARRPNSSGFSTSSDDKDNEIYHLQEHLKEKDRVIKEITDDSKALREALRTIKNKMKESGNIVELRRKLKIEREVNVELKESVERLRKELRDKEQQYSHQSPEDSDDEGKLKRELDLSVCLDKQLMEVVQSDDRAFPNNVAHQSVEIEHRLQEVNKINDELKKLKNDAEIERDMLKFQVAEYEDRILQIKCNLEEESKKVTKLNDELFAERNLVRSLKVQLERERRSTQSNEMQHSELIELLHIKLKSSLDMENKLRQNLSALRQEHKNLEVQLGTVKAEIQSQKTDEHLGITNLLATEQKKHLHLVEEFEKEQRKNNELISILTKVESEKDRYKKDLEITVEEKEQLINDLTVAQGKKEHLEVDLKRVQKILKEKESECKWLQKKNAAMNEMESKIQAQKLSKENEIKELKRELYNAKEVISDLETDMKQSKQELAEAVSREMSIAESLNKIKKNESELRKQMNVARQEETRLKSVIAKLNEHINNSIHRVLDFSKQDDNDSLMKDKFTQELNGLVKKYSLEKSALNEKVIQLQLENEQFKSMIKSLESQVIELKKYMQKHNIPSLSKLQQFYGKYLRIENRRKALTFQKRYLLSILGGYQHAEENTLAMLARLTLSERSFILVKNKQKNPRRRFISVAITIISIHRMKWQVSRWRTGKRSGAMTLIENTNESFLPLRRSASSHSPPVRERIALASSGIVGKCNQYYERMRAAQENLASAISKVGSSDVAPE
ncbi:uncharacterized protein [Prorops nasuta]|uniref:uncharacterized protein isoform X2 n=1 Tax=Prorops nasuta TaxID=863751 RepID=UPI0034CEBACF